MLSRQSWPALAFAAVTAVAVCWHLSPDGGAWRALYQGTRSDEEYPRDEEHEPKLRYLTWSHAVRARVAQALVRGELTLGEAAACFRQVNALRPPGLRSSAEHFRGGSEEERICRQVIRYVGVALEDETRDGGLVLHLEAELEGRVRRGDLRLPSPPSSLVGRFDLDAR
jgi:hypothetical protein